MLHQAWSDGSFFPVINRSARSLVEHGATVVWAVEAASWVEAMARYHAWRGWEPYRPMDDDSGAYTAEQEAEAVAEGSQDPVPGTASTDSPTPPDRGTQR